MALSISSSVRRTFANTYVHNSSTPVRKVRFSLPCDVRSVILDFKNKKSTKVYEDVVRSIRDEEIEDEELHHFLRNIRECISLLDTTVIHIVIVILKLKWANRSEETAEEFQGFLIDLLSAHNYYTKNALEELVVIFKSENAWENNSLSKEAKISFDRVHEVLNVLLRVIPMSSNLLKETVDSYFPYLRKSVLEHQSYMYNMFRMLDYQPSLRVDFMFIIVNRLILLDVNAPKHKIQRVEEKDEEQFEMEQDDFINDHNMKHEIANTLDQTLYIFYNYLYVTCHDISVSPPKVKWEETKKLFEEVVQIFNNLILPTHATHHVQFIVFYLCSFQVTLADAFLTNLWQKVTSPRVASVVRQTAAAYISSFLSRASYVSVKMLMYRLSEIVNWIHNYIANQDGLEYSHSELKIHPVFYSVCQAVFYVITCRYKEIVNSRKGLLFLQSLNLTKIVTCSCNPLKVCLPSIVKNFAAITRNYQLAYCYTIIEHNSRTKLPVIDMNEQGVTSESPQSDILDTFFPFDPYILKRSSSFISKIYRDAQPSVDDESIHSAGKPVHDEEDDFLSDYTANTSAIPILGLSPC